MSLSQLRRLTGLPVLGNVSLKQSLVYSVRNKKEALNYSIAVTGLFIIYIGFMAFDIFRAMHD